jgi:hypothetical protein
VDRWLAFYEDRPAMTRTVESKTALDAAKDFALLSPRGDDCAVVVAREAEAGLQEFFERRTGVFAARELPPEPPALPTEAALAATTPPTDDAAPLQPKGYLLSDNWPTGGYHGWLVSNSFLKRALAVTGYSFVGYALITLTLWLLFLGGLTGCWTLVQLFGHR